MRYDTRVILDKIESSIVLSAKDGEYEYESIAAIPTELWDAEMVIVAIEARENKIILHLDKNRMERNSLGTDWVTEDLERTGKEPSFF